MPVKSATARCSRKELRRTHYEQLLAYAKAAQREGWYYGNKAQFRARHEDIVAFLEAEISRRS